MVKQPDDDLFGNTTMTFGEHIEELRVCLSRGLVGLVLGCLIGLAVAGYVVDYIQKPLKRALEDHYITKTVADLKEEYERGDVKLAPEVERFVREKRFVFEKIYVETSELQRVGSVLEQYEQRQSSEPVAETPETTAAAQPAETKASEPEPETAAQPAEPKASEPEPETVAQPAEPKASEPEPETVAAAAEPLGASPNETKPDGAVDTDDADEGDRGLIILGNEIPAPKPVLITARVWRPINTMVKALNAQEAFMIWLKAAFVSGLVLSSPYLFWQIWLFVAAGLYPHEKRYVYIYLPMSIILFLAGAATAFFFVFKYVLDFLFSFNQMMKIDPDPRISEWLGFVLILPLGFGLAFQLPLVMLFLQRIGIFTIQIYLDKWRIAVLVIFIISMLLTPAEPVSMLMMAVPLTFLYFLGIAMCKWMPKNRSPFEEGYEP